MSEEKQTFTDPETGEEIESTGWARWGAGLIVGWVVGLVAGLVAGLVVGLVIGLGISLADGLVVGLAAGLFLAQIFTLLGLFVGLVFDLLVRLGVDIAYGRSNSLYQRAHDDIARQQHFRRQRMLQRKLLEEEWAGVPNRALSRAQRHSEPEPTDKSLSQSQVRKKGKPHLAGTETETEEGKIEAQEEP